jgi:hypothetical protein
MPDDWRGGFCVPVPKKSNQAVTTDNARGIILLSHLGKVVAKKVRSVLACVFEGDAEASQLGGRPGRSIDLATHWLQQRADLAAARNRSTAEVFVDFKAAYYSVSRLVAFAQMRRAGASEKMVRMAEEWHESSWFAVKGAPELTMLKDGARPGDPLADVVFNYAFSALLETIKASFAREGLVVDITANIAQDRARAASPPV